MKTRKTRHWFTLKAKSRCNRTILALAVSLMATVALQSSAATQNWQTVDDFAPAGANAEAHGVAVDSAGRIYVAGTANGHGVVRFSSDGGTTWSTRDDFVYPSESNNVFNAITMDRQGNVFVGGSSQNRGLRWIVLRSADQGATWEIVDDYYRPMIDPLHPGTNGVVFSLSSDSQGRVYGAGRMYETGPSYLNWWVRGSDIGGTNWDTKLFLFSGYTDVSQLTCAGEDVYVTGDTSPGEGFTGFILGSGDHGATWNTNFQSTSESYHAMTSDSAGNVYSAGDTSTPNSHDWLVRKGVPGSSNWTILDQFSDSGGPQSITADAAGNICVAGNSADPQADTNGFHYTIFTWLTRQYSVTTGQWTTTDLFSYSTIPTNMVTAAMGTAIAPDGSAFVVGFGTSDSGQRHWIVRKRGAATATPQDQAQALIGEVNSLMAAKTLPHGSGNALLASLRTALSSLNRGNANAACGQLAAFVGKVQSLTQQRQLSQANGQALVSAANDLRATLGCGHQ
jgi:hypothetical protein